MESNEILAACAEDLGCDAHHLDESTTLDGIDSLELVSLVSHLQNKFGVTIPDRSMEHIETFGDIVRLVQRVAQTA